MAPATNAPPPVHPDPEPFVQVPDDDPRMALPYLREHPEFFREQCLKIITKTRGRQPLRPNYTQRFIIDTINRLRAQGIPPRLLCVKSRQVGVSTISEGLLFEGCYLHPDKTALIVAHTEDDAKGLFRMTRRFNRMLPTTLRFKDRLDNVKELEFPNESRLQVETEGEIRSMTAQYFHGSEFAFWKHPRETLTAALQTMPNSPDTLAILETTANGVSNMAYEMFVNAMNQEHDPDLPPWERGWVPIFIPWWRHEEYLMRPWFTPDQTTHEERVLAKKHGLNMRQLAWRRWCIRSNCHGDPEVFQVEYPATWEEAFLLTGRPIFSREGLEHYAHEQPPLNTESKWAAAKPSEIEMDELHKVPRIDPIEKGRLRIFVPFNERHTYIVSADPSEGDVKSDPTPIEVLDQMTLEFVAEWWGRTPPDVLGRYAALIGLYYGNAQINAEANNHGIEFFKTLMDMSYPNIWFRTTHEESVAGEVTQKPGLWETNKMKHTCMTIMRRYVREKRGAIYSPILLGEMGTVVYEKKETARTTKITKPSGKFMDTVIAAGIALYTHRGAEEAPLLPLPELQIVSAQAQVMLLRDRDPEAAEAAALDLTGMTAADLDRLYEAREQRRLREERVGYGRQR